MGSVVSALDPMRGQQITLTQKWATSRPVAVVKSIVMAAPKQPPMPVGWKRWPKGKAVDSSAQTLASVALRMLPMGGLSVGADASGKPVGAFKEFHFDNHPDPSRAPYYHPGISLLVPV
jgi:hypothetical protein